MIKLGVNSVLFKKYPFAEAARAIKQAGYDGVEVSALEGMVDHLMPTNFSSVKADIKAAIEETGLELLSCEVATQDRNRVKATLEACAEIGIPVVNIGPGGKTDDEESFKQVIESISALAEIAASYKVTLCCKAHVTNAVWNTPTTLRLMEAVQNPWFGIDMDPSHVYRAGEKPEKALPAVLSRTKHIHIRDCKGPGPSPGEPALQACGRGDIDLFGYFKAMAEGKYSGPVCLEVIGPELDMTSAAIIAAESYGYMNACLKILGAR